MADSTVLSVRLEKQVKERLEKLAESTQRSKSWLAGEAIRQYVEVNLWQIEGIEQGLARLDRGERVAHEDVRAWVDSWGGDEELARPKPPK